MPNIFWYSLLNVIGAAMIIGVLLYKKSVSRISLILFLTLGLLTVGEYFILVIFGAYQYLLGTFDDFIADDLIAFILGNYLLWSGTAILVATFSLGNRWIIALAGLFMLIEILFLNLGIFEHHWWKTYMTGILFFFAMNLIKTWLLRLNERPYLFLRYMTLFLIALFFIHVPMHFLLLTGKQHYTVGVFENIYQDSILFGLPYHAGLAFIFVYCCCVLQNRFWCLAPVLFFLLSDFILFKMNILVFLNQWDFLHLALFRTLTLVIFVYYKKASRTEFLVKSKFG